jgi:hypothetical protein
MVQLISFNIIQTNKQQTQFRYFLQPLFIMYYTPLMIIKYLIGPYKNEKKQAFATHEKIIEGWKDAIRAAELEVGFSPLRVTGTF